MDRRHELEPSTSGASAARRSSVRNLQELYTVAVGVALAVAIERLMSEAETLAEATHVAWGRIPMLVA